MPPEHLEGERTTSTAKLTLLIVSALAVAGTLTSGLWPFNFFPRNQVERLADAGLRFDWDGIIYSRQPAIVPLQNQDAITVELWLKPSDKSFLHYGEILAFFNSGRDGFVVAQNGDALVAHSEYSVAGTAQTRPGDPDAPGVFEPGVARLYTVTSGSDGTAIYADGRLTTRYPGLVPLPASLSGRLVVGHSPAGYHPWSGDIRGLAIYSRALRPEEVTENHRRWLAGDIAALTRAQQIVWLTRFDDADRRVVRNRVAGGGELIIPQHYQPMQRKVLTLPSRRSRPDVGDFVLNIFGLIPLGFTISLLAAILGRSPRRAVLYATLFGMGTSLTIELLQPFLPSRTSSLLDLINNTLGAALGGAMAVATFYLARTTRLKPPSTRAAKSG